MNFCICIPCMTTIQIKIYISSTIGSFFCPILVSSPSPKGGLYSDLHYHRWILSDSELYKNWNHTVYTFCVWFLSCNIIFVRFSHVFTLLFIATYIFSLFTKKKFTFVVYSEVIFPNKNERFMLNKPNFSMILSDEHL